MSYYVFGCIQEYYDKKDRYFVLDGVTAEKAAAAFRCKTWGEYAKLHGYTWEEARSEWELDLEEEEGGSKIHPHDEFDYGEQIVRELHVFPDPRNVAYWELAGELPWEEDEVLARTFTVDHGTPAGHIQSISTPDREGIERMIEILEAKHQRKVVFREDDQLVAAALWGWPESD